MKAEIHGNGLPNLHLACAIPNNTYYEIIVYHDPVLFFETVDGEGMIAPPDLPGTGLIFDWSEVEKKAYAQV